MKLAILGPAFAGKTTVFNALTGASEDLSDFSGGGKEHRREVAVPDPRLDRLRDDWQPKKITPARMEILDMPGYGGAEKYFADARQQEALVRVIRAFKDDAIPHPRDRIDWKADRDDLDADFVLQDLAMVERRIEKLEVTSKKPHKRQKEEAEELEIFRRLHPSLSDGVPLKKTVEPGEREALANYGFLTLKPTLTLINVGDEDDPEALGIPSAPEPKPGEVVDDYTLAIKARLEAEVAQLDEADRAEFLADFGVTEPIRDRLIRLGYALLGLQSFLTGGPKEVRAWTIRRGDTAVQAAKVIHSDIARGFIRAEIVGWGDYLACGDWKKAKEAKKMRLEGKDYVMQDGDVVEFRHGG
ncbi:MAG: DUF933 domain-containing protein [Planctomycetota bacterium]